jgi:hypothetical protein
VIKKDKMGRAHSIHVEIRKAYTVLVGKPEGKGPLRRPTDRWKANTGCNRIRYTNLKMYCDQTNSDITTQFVAECLPTLQVLCPWSPQIGVLQSSIKMAYFTDMEKATWV